LPPSAGAPFLSALAGAPFLSPPHPGRRSRARMRNAAWGPWERSAGNKGIGGSSHIWIVRNGAGWRRIARRLVYSQSTATLRTPLPWSYFLAIAQTDGVVNPATDLVPLCSNCHSMVHRKRGEILPVERLRKIISQRN